MAEFGEYDSEGPGADSRMDENAPASSQPSPSGTPSDREFDPKTTAFIGEWVKKIKRAKKHHGDTFKRMKTCMEMAKNGHDKTWGSEKYSVPIINRLVNTAVAQLYAKNPTALAKRKRRRMFTVWDGQIASLNEAAQAIQAAQQMGQMPDPNHLAIANDAEKVKSYDTLVDGIADTLTLLTQHFADDPAAMYKQQFKALVRRTKVCGASYVKLAFERLLEPDPEVTVKKSNATEQLATLRQLIAEKSRDEFDDEAAEMEQLKTLLADLDQQPDLIVREGPLFVFPRATNIIIDPKCFHLKTLAGAGWYAEEMEKTPDEIERIWKVDVTGEYTGYKPDNYRDAETDEKDNPGKVWRVMNRDTGQEFVICEGYRDYIQPPAPPAVKLSRFWDIFPLVFNEIEDDKDIFPPSDVWNSRHIQNEYNRSREGLREHRMQNRPGYIAAQGAFEEGDLDKLQTHASGQIISIAQMQQGDKIADKLQAKPVMAIDPKMYDTTENWNDFLRVVGQQQADMGPTTTATATESSIAEQGRSISTADLTDDLDDMLGLLFQATGELMLVEMAKETVENIVGPGAVWPDMPQTREEIAEEIILGVKGGSSGRPNQAADLAKMERAMPTLLQLPNVNPVPWSQRLLDLLDVDAEDAIVQGLPSVVALNQMLAKQMGTQPGTGDAATDPNQQGEHGAQNAPQQPGVPPGPQAGHPAPVTGTMAPPGAA